MKVCVLSSGSKGNSTLVTTDKVKILIDLGTTSKYVENELLNMNIKPGEISYILITHSHVDHIKGLKVFIKRYNPTILVTEDMLKVLNEEIGEFKYKFYEDKKAELDDVTINVIKTSHDAEESIGFVLENNNSKAVYITDTGYINKKYFKLLSNNDLYILESNHDVKMLMDGPYPYYLKQRVQGDKGHLSNKQASEYLCKLIGNKTKKIVFAHISEHNNTYEKVLETFKEELDRNDKQFCNVIIAKQNEVSELIEI